MIAKFHEFSKKFPRFLPPSALKNANPYKKKETLTFTNMASIQIVLSADAILQKTDIITVESCGPIYRLTKLFIEKGKTSFGYVGDREFCYSTYQAWSSLKNVLEGYNLSLKMKTVFYSIRYRTSGFY